MAFVINQHTTYRIPTAPSSPVRHALKMVQRDHEQVLGTAPRLISGTNEPADIVIRYAAPEDCCPNWPEAFCFRFVKDGDRTELHIAADDDLGLVYAILEFSGKHLGVDPFWFWANLPPERRSRIEIPENDYDSQEPFVRFRGWFVNDEVCLIGWKEEYPPTREVWEPVFEALLRCGGNMVIPGTDLPRHGVHADMAAEMGLWVTHHHAEPLGAEMFLRAYPDKKASYQENPELFEALWEEAIEKQKDHRVVWVLSFRGQGDQPFWIQDPAFNTPEKRGEMISRVVRKQYDMVRAKVANPQCSVALYGEISELYKADHIEIPDDIIKIWADNGYGKMVSRRNGNENLRIPALPELQDKGRHGIYYHVTFHDLQASNHLTLFPTTTDLIGREVEQAFKAGAKDYVLVNSGNIRPHVYTLDLIRELWTKGEASVEEHLQSFVSRMFPSGSPEIAAMFNDYARRTIKYGSNEDDRAGEEFYHHPARQIVGHWLQGRSEQPDSRLYWVTGTVDFPEQVEWFRRKCSETIPGWIELKERIEKLLPELAEPDQIRLKDHLLFHVELHMSGCEGFEALGQSYAAYREGNFPLAFVYASQAMWKYEKGLIVLKQAEHGKWGNFFRADWLTNIESTVQNMDTLRRWLRMHGDSPDFFAWYKQYLMPETEKYIYLENTHRNPLSDNELAKRLAVKFGV
ncbi:glycosyl hydrolase 115 family protein [Halalkalibacterium halodurans]|uniref:glycosyl hydrolase 115 family protein n=1 Tax=Halalkalibacterium halodurans TaxID=86665 RepID=UPI002AA9DEAF|nr:glycosyl hydrolase 115 family protein [Halalkalibacterium halodurans]MDY7223274.1 glycosyl hydrolase 115 family protein [Halalkalibacterium halodurans]MDY7242495.1 glycosyl hydrolase 115 family protein [Halalkalibacterium halodurans]